MWEAHGPGIAQDYLAKVEIDAPKSKERALCALKTSGSSSNVDPVDVVCQYAVRIGRRKRDQMSILEENCVTRVRYPMMMHVIVIPLDVQDRHANPAPYISGRGPIRAKIYR